MAGKIILLAGEGLSTNIIYHALEKNYDLSAVVIEAPENKFTFIKRRIKKLGILTTAGQILFQLIIPHMLKLMSGKRTKQILQTNDLVINEISPEKITRVNSVNGDDCRKILQSVNPDLVIVNGTRIISKNILQCIPAKFINVHAGITPKYRGVHGGYWALVNNDEQNCGVTIHFVDQGIDTGEVLFQRTITATNMDNFTTYPLLQIASAIPHLKKLISDILQGNAESKRITGESHLWSHPTLFQYLSNRMKHHVK